MGHLLISDVQRVNKTSWVHSPPHKSWFSNLAIWELEYLDQMLDGQLKLPESRGWEWVDTANSTEGTPDLPRGWEFCLNLFYVSRVTWDIIQESTTASTISVNVWLKKTRQGLIGPDNELSLSNSLWKPFQQDVEDHMASQGENRRECKSWIPRTGPWWLTSPAKLHRLHPQSPPKSLHWMP